MGKKKTKEEFIKEAREKHGGKYDYTKVDYINGATKVCIICPKHGHGEFLQRPSDHLNGYGCSKCGKEANRLSKEDFIKKAKKIHDDKYDYSKVEYVNNHTKICIICPQHDHGEFWQAPNSHLQGHGCSKCGDENSREKRSSSKEEFIKKAREKHGDKYDYTKVNYVNSNTKVCVKCPEHGEFWQIPTDHTQGHGCPKCHFKTISDRCRLSKEEFIKKAREKHGDKYDYSKVDYVNCETKVCIICPEHGEFWQQAKSHTLGIGCPKCGGKYSPTKEEWVVLANEVHNGKYDYSKVDYVNNKIKVRIICPEHGEFWQQAKSHINGNGCPKCSECYVPTTEEWIASARKVHGNKYEYAKVNYVNSKKKVCIICPKHGEFWQAPYNHAQGQCCPKCNLSNLERSVMNYLDEHGITYDYQKRFDWLGRQSLDFYLPDYKVGIECQGLQHFEEIDYFGGKEGLNECKKRDKRKFKKCQKNGIKVLYYSNLGIEYPYDVFEDLDLLFKEIKN